MTALDHFTAELTGRVATMADGAMGVLLLSDGDKLCVAYFGCPKHIAQMMVTDAVANMVDANHKTFLPAPVLPRS